MSNLQSKLTAVKFEPVVARKAVTPGGGVLIFGVIFPTLVIAVELVSRMCALTFFDPMPSWWHIIAVCFVPAGNLAIWICLRKNVTPYAGWLAFANGAAIAIAGFYALLFIPLLPLAMVGIMVLVGLLPFAPLVSFACALRLWGKLRNRCKDRSLRRPLIGGLAAGLTLLLALDVPAAATRLGIAWAASSVPSERAHGITLLRTLGDDDLLLRLCYDAVGRPTGLLSTFVMLAGNGLLTPGEQQFARSPAEAREIYYRVHGVPFNAKAPPYEQGRWSRFGDFAFDRDHGGTEVGGRLKGLDMIASRLDGSISADDAVAYLEWTFELRNTALVDREARFELELPPGAVVSRATLWVDGEEREAAYGGRGEVRAAYQQVAVQQRRDPLLVTSKGADRVLAQAFPVRAGGTLKLKLGITAPLQLADTSKARLVLPAVVDRNFSFAADMQHHLWIESRRAMAGSLSGLTASSVDDHLFRLAGAFNDGALSRTRPVVTVERDPAAGKVSARIGDGELIVQEIVQEIAPHDPPATATVMLVIDGSVSLAGKAASLIRALDAIAPTLKVGAIIAAEPMQQVAPAPWSDAQKQAIITLIRSASFAGGQDNTPALTAALQALEPAPNATLVWIHGPQPVSFHGSAAVLEQATARLSHLPAVVLYGLEPGPNVLLPDAPWVWSTRSLPRTGTPDKDLSSLFAALSHGAPAIRRLQAQPIDGVTRGSEHIVRLWANDRVLELMRQNATANRGAATALAARYHLVTPVSGAVVLENRQQYEQNGLTPVSQGTVPTIPEPRDWALALIATAALSWFAWRHRQRLART